VVVLVWEIDNFISKSAFVRGIAHHEDHSFKTQISQTDAGIG